MANENKDSKRSVQKTLTSTLHLGPHDTMERFCFMFMAFMLMFVLIVGSAVHQKYERSKVRLTEDAIYGGTEKMFSLTQDYLTIDGVWSNEGHTKAFVLLHIPGGMDNLSTQAADYQMLMTKADGKAMTDSPTGSIYVFGNTGYIGLGFTNTAGFQPDAYKVTFRNISFLSEGDEEAAKAMHDGQDGSYAHHNEFNFVVNFAATSAKTAKFYDKVDYTATDIYNELVQTQLIENKQAECDEAISSINTSMRKANEYARRLESAGVTMDYNLPAEIYGDGVSSEASENAMYFDSSYMLYSDEGKLSSADGFFTCVDTSKKSEETEGQKLYLSTDYVFPGGLNYNYQTLDSSSNLLAEVLEPTGMTYSELVTSLEEEATTYSVDTNLSFGEYVDTQNGTVFTKEQAGTDLVGEASKKDIQNLETELSNIYNQKRILQTRTLVELLKLYYDSNSMNNMTSVYMNDDALVLY